MLIFFKFTVLNASHNRMLSNVPFLLCKKTANIEIDLSNTLFSQHVNWSGQIIRQRNTLDAEFPEISQTCTKSIQHAQTLDLSSNNLSCPTKLSYQDPFYAYDHLGETSAIITGKVFVENFDIYIPGNEKLWRKIWHASTCTFYQMVSNMRDLSYLDLRNNSIRTLEYSLVSEFCFACILKKFISGKAFVLLYLLILFVLFISFFSYFLRFSLLPLITLSQKTIHWVAAVESISRNVLLHLLYSLLRPHLSLTSGCRRSWQPVPRCQIRWCMELLRKLPPMHNS